MDCIFCKIINGEIPAIKILDEKQILAFMDINPLAQGHMLVIPKNHAENILDISEDDLAAVINAAKRCAEAAKSGLKAEGITVLQLNGKASNQVVPHLHFHVIPRWKNDGIPVAKWEPKAGDMEEIEKTAGKVKEHIS
jgi:histidine triad (HIT) family protein